MICFLNKKNNYLFVFSGILLFSFCTTNNEKTVSNNSPCYCDSVYFKINRKTEKEFLCYKEYKCYKLVVKKNDYKLTEHYISKPNFSYQSIITKNGQIIDSISNCLVLSNSDTSVYIKYIGPKVDSINVYTLFNNDTIKIQHSLLNDFMLSYRIFNYDTNKVVVDIFFFKYMVIDGKKGRVLTKRTIELSSFKNLKENSFDKLLLETVDCMKSNN